MDRKPVIAPDDVLKQFSGAADRYNSAARLQEGMAGDSLAIAAIY